MQRAFLEKAVVSSTEYGMIHGCYYRSLTGGGPPEYYTSSISGLTFWELHYGVISLPKALAATGYSARLVSAFGKVEP
jgi:hypothetical protein